MKSRAQPAATPKPAKGIKPAKPAPDAGVRGPAGRYHAFRCGCAGARCGGCHGSTEDGDAALFGLLWPLGESVKLDSTIDRRTLRAQIARLGEMGYALDFKTQGGAARPNCNLRDRRHRIRGVLHPPAGASPCGEALAIFWVFIMSTIACITPFYAGRNRVAGRLQDGSRACPAWLRTVLGSLGRTLFSSAIDAQASGLPEDQRVQALEIAAQEWDYATPAERQEPRTGMRSMATARMGSGSATAPAGCDRDDDDWD